NREHDIDAARPGLEIDVQDRLHSQGVVERDGTLVDGEPGAEEHHLPLRNVDAAEQSGIAGGAAQAQVGFGLEIFGEGGFELGVESGVDLDIERHAPQKTGPGGCRAHGLGGFRQQRADIGFRIEAGAADGDGSREHAAIRRPGQIQAGVRDGADTFGITHAHLHGLRVQPENDRTAAVAGEARDLDLAAAGLTAQVLDGGAVAGEQDHAVGLGEAVGETGDIHRRVVDLHAPVDLGRVERPAHGGVGGDGAGSVEVATEFAYGGQIEAAGY